MTQLIHAFALPKGKKEVCTAVTDAISIYERRYATMPTLFQAHPTRIPDLTPLVEKMEGVVLKENPITSKQQLWLTHDEVRKRDEKTTRS